MLPQPTISPGTAADYTALAPLHYRAGPPATCARVLVAHWRDHLAGILIVSMPTLNARWRPLLWPGEFDSPDRRENAQRINSQLRCISRVVIDPRFRAMGFATALIRAYLASPLTPRTEAVAAMGAVSGFFIAAGMREVVPPPTLRDRALLSALRKANLPPWRLIDPAFITALSPTRRDPLELALRRWANDARSTRAGASAPLPRLIDLAARAVASPLATRAYGFDSGKNSEKRNSEGAEQAEGSRDQREQSDRFAPIGKRP